jgi:riboflavin kinase/FMN adenylyltransferase
VEVPNSVCLPADGVYAGWYLRPDGIVHPCALNLGRRPTFYEHADHSLLEAHLFDFDGDLYYERARVEFANFLRSERKFDGIESLIAQLKHDCEHARQLLGV